MNTLEAEAAIFSLTPAVNLNGDSYKTLEQNWKTFHEKLEEALKAFPEVHGRNYYIKQGENPTGNAFDERDKLARKLKQVAEVTKGVRQEIYAQRLRK